MTQGSGRPRTSTDERSVKLVADALEEDRRATYEELSRATGAETSQGNVQEPTSVVQSHIADVSKKTSRLWVGSVASCAIQSRHESTGPRLISKVKRTYA